jgi:carbon storage regulator
MSAKLLSVTGFGMGTSRQGGFIMLVLSRKLGEQIVIGDNVTVTVLEVRGGRVKLGVTGPAEVPIHREELQRRIGVYPPALCCAECA